MNNEKIFGYVKFKDEEYPFEFENNGLTIIPYSKNKQLELSMEWLHNFGNSGLRNKWIEKITIEGVTSENKGIKFYASNNPGINNGYYYYIVDYVYIYDIDKDNNMIPIKGIKFMGNECNYFYNISRYINSNYQSEGKLWKKYKFEINSEDDYQFGKFRWKNYSVECKGSFYWHKKANIYAPLELNSILIFQLSRPTINVEDVYELINIQKAFLSFVTYRKNISFTEIETYSLNEDNLRRKAGKFYFFNCEEIEAEPKNLKQMITYENLNSDISKIYYDISKYNIYTRHFPNSFKERRKYNPNRMLAILIAFENDYKIIYKNVKIRSNEYYEVKNDVLDYILKKRSDKQCSKKEREKYKKIYKSIENIELGYGDYLRYALNDNFEILEPFIKQRYKVKHAKRIINDCSKRLNSIRNQIAHGNLNFNYKPINSSDICLVEFLLYSMRLKKLGITKKIIQNKINELFNTNIIIE